MIYENIEGGSGVMFGFFYGCYGAFYCLLLTNLDISGEDDICVAELLNRVYMSIVFILLLFPRVIVLALTLTLSPKLRYK